MKPGVKANPHVSRAVPGWETTATLESLQRLIDIAGQVPAAVGRRADLSVSEVHALRHLTDCSTGPAALARLLGVTTAASSGVVDRLVARGHAERRPHPEDGRRTEVVITDSGMTETVELMRPMFARLAEVDSALSDEERAVVLRYLTGAIEAMETLL